LDEVKGKRKMEEGERLTRLIKPLNLRK